MVTSAGRFGYAVYFFVTLDHPVKPGDDEHKAQLNRVMTSINPD